jgi:hypothetical protein
MKLDELKEQILDQLKALWEKIQESPLFIQLKEKYDELTPNAQKGVTAAAGFLVALFILSFPFGWISQSSDSLVKYERNRKLIEDFLKVQKDLQSAPNVPTTASAGQVQSAANDIIEKSGIGKTQIKFSGLGSSETPPYLPSYIEYSSVRLQLEKLNLTQVLDLGVKFQNMNRLAKLMGLEMTANKEDNHYYDVNFNLAVFSAKVANVSEEAEEEPAARPSRSRKK